MFTKQVVHDTVAYHSPTHVQHVSEQRLPPANSPIFYGFCMMTCGMKYACGQFRAAVLGLYRPETVPSQLLVYSPPPQPHWQDSARI